MAVRASCADDALVCRCNRVSRSTIVEAVAEHGLGTVQQVAERTAAGASCGSCRSAVHALLVERGVRVRDGAPVCECTELDHDGLRAEIAARDLDSVDEVLAGLGFRGDGCARCRPAINYYLLCERPEAYVDDPQSRVANERTHANIQRDGTYSVVPRMFGGVVSPAQLRAIADAADKFDIPMVKITGAQRVDLLGVPKEKLPAVWRELGKAGLVSGHAYARGVRNVKTCVGSDWCRYGIGDAVGLGVAIEEMTWGSWTPHKFKMAVSGCARNCAEATIKDLGIVIVEEGWDIYVGGSAGMRVRPARRLVRATSEREVLEYAGAFLQLYREEGWYGERTGAFVQRVGIAYLKERVVKDPAGRGVLFRRFHRSQHGHQADPWAQHSGGDGADFVPLSRVTASPETAS